MHVLLSGLMHFQLIFSVLCARCEELCLMAIMCKYLNGLYSILRGILL